MWSFLHGDWHGFFRNNLLVAPGALFVACSLLWPRTFHKPWISWTAMAVLLAFGILRNFPWEPFTLLAPVGLQGTPP